MKLKVPYYLVEYQEKDKFGFLVTKTREFRTIQAAVAFIKQANAQPLSHATIIEDYENIDDPGN